MYKPSISRAFKAYFKNPITCDFFMNKTCPFLIQSINVFPKSFIWYPSMCENVRKFEIKFSLMLHSRDSHLNYKVNYPSQNSTHKINKTIERIEPRMHCVMIKEKSDFTYQQSKKAVLP